MSESLSPAQMLEVYKNLDTALVSLGFDGFTVHHEVCRSTREPGASYLQCTFAYDGRQLVVRSKPFTGNPPAKREFEAQVLTRVLQSFQDDD